MNQVELVTADEMARRCSVSPVTLARWRRRGLIPAIRVNASTFRYDPADVLRALREHSPQPTFGACR